MPSLLPGFEYDLFISYRQKDNKGERWVTEFVHALQAELEATFKEDISIYFDENPHDGLHEHHDVDDSLRDKLKCIVFLPILSRTYCDPKSFAFEHEFKAFAAQAASDSLGLKLKLPGGNVASRVLPIRIHELSRGDTDQFEAVTGSVLRSIDFVYRETGVNRPLKPADQRNENLSRTDYRNQVNKVANAISEILAAVRRPAPGGNAEDRPAVASEPRAEELPPITRRNLAGALAYIRRIRMSPVVMLSVALVVAAGALLFVMQQRQEVQSRTTEYLPIEFKDPFRTRHSWDPTVHLSNDGRKIFYYSGTGRLPRVYDLTSGRSTPMAEETPSFIRFCWSPSDEWAVVRTAAWMGQLYLTSPATGQYRKIADSALSIQLSWTKSDWIYYANTQGDLARVHAREERSEIVLKRESDWTLPAPVEDLGHGRLIFGRRRIDLIDPNQVELRIFDLRSRKSVPLEKGLRAIFDERNGVLIIAQANGDLLAARFDAEAGRPIGSFVKVLDGVETRNQGAAVDASFGISRSGDLLYITREKISRDEIAWVDRAGIESKNRVIMNGWVGGLDLSPNGERIVATIETDYGIPPHVWLKNLVDGTEQKVTAGKILDYHPKFVSSGAAITFVSPRDFQNWDLYRQPLDGKSGLEKILDRPGDVQDPHFSPEEQAVVFTERDVSGQLDVRVHNFGQDPGISDIAATGANESSARFSPDGRYIAYVSDEGGKSRVYVVPYPNPNKLRWQISAEGGSLPAWSHRGNELFFRTPGDDIVSIKVNTDGGFSPGKPERLFGLNKMFWTAVVTPDDEHFILVHRDMRAPGQVILVKNWMQEVLRKLDGK